MAHKKFIVGILIIVGLIGVALALDYIASRTKNPHSITPMTLAGDVTYLERIALPPGSTVQVALQDTSRADAPAATIAETTIVTDGENVPIPFMLTYDASSINQTAVYTLSARILVNNELRWINTESVPVLTNGAPTNDVSVLVRSAAISTPEESEGSEEPSEETKQLVSIGTEFKLDSFNGTKVPATSSFTLSLTETHVNAKFCNLMNGAYTFENGTITAKQMISTLMLCQPDSTMKMESLFGKILSEGATISQTGDELSISKGSDTFIYKKAQ